METVSCITLGAFQTNCYLIKENEHVLIIDPGARAEKIMKYISEDETVDGIVLTHGHFDHIGAVDDLMKQYHCKCYLHVDDQPLARDKKLNSMSGYSAHISSPIEDLKEGEMTIGIFTIQVFHTPGHTPGSCMIQYHDILYSGDMLFYHSIGRTDLPLGDDRDMKDSIRFVKTMDPGLRVCPGHGELTTIEEEIQNNPFF